MAKERKRVTAKHVEAEDARAFDLPKVNVHAEIDEDAWGKDGLTLKQRRFVKAYVGPAAGNATKAAEMAGYSSDNRVALATTGAENLRKPQIQRAIASALSRHHGGPKWTMAGIVELAKGNMADYVSIDPNGNASIDLAKAHAGGAMGIVKKLKVRNTDAGQEIEIQTYDRLAALQTLAKIHGSLIERTEHSGTIESRQTIDLRNLTVEELRDLQRILSAANRRSGSPDDAIPASSN